MEIKEAKHNLMTHAGKIYATFGSEAQVNLFIKVCRHSKNSVLSNSATPHICIVNICLCDNHVRNGSETGTVTKLLLKPVQNKQKPANSRKLKIALSDGGQRDLVGFFVRSQNGDLIFQDRRFQPLTHPSEAKESFHCSLSVKFATAVHAG
jgi:hypothetical protein